MVFGGWGGDVSAASSLPPLRPPLPSFPPPLLRHSRLARESIRRSFAVRSGVGGWFGALRCGRGWVWVPACAGTTGRGGGGEGAGGAVCERVLRTFGSLCCERGWVWVPACAGTTEGGRGRRRRGDLVTPHAAQHRLFRHFLSSVIPASSLPSFPPCAGIHSALVRGAACERGLEVVWGFVLGTGLGLGSRVRGNDGDGERGRRRRGDSVTPACCPAPSLPPLPLLRHSRLLSSVIPALRGNPFGDRWRGGLRAGAGGGLGLCAADGVGFGFPRARERRRWGVGTRGGGG